MTDKLTPITLDYETHWATGYTLSSMSAIEYVSDPRFEVISCATKIGLDGETQVTFGFDETKALFDTIDWSRALVIGHNNAEFDALIHAWKFGINPAMWACTQAMARPIHAKDAPVYINDKKYGPLSLGKLAHDYGLGTKGNLEAGVLGNTKGKRLADFTDEERRLMAVYNKQDTDLTAQLFVALQRQTSLADLRLIDITMRMMLQPQFEADMRLLDRVRRAEQARKRKILHELAQHLGIGSGDELRQQLKSTAKFAQLVRTLGYDVPTKVSEKTGKAIPAVAKADAEMEQLCSHADERVAAAAQARLGVQSDLLESRCSRFIRAAEACGGRKPIALRWCGADMTGRWSGSQKMNDQNLFRIGKKTKLSDGLRYSLRAPKDHLVVAVDSSGIELRVNHFLWQVQSTMQAFHHDVDADLYRLFAGEKLYHTDPASIPKTSPMRHMGKLAQLSLQYGTGPVKFADTARQQGVELSLDEAREIVAAWRDMYAEIVQGWRRCGDALPMIVDGTSHAVDPWGHVQVGHNCLNTPVGTIRYPALRYELSPDGSREEWQFGYGDTTRRLYGAKCVENIVQHLAGGILKEYVLAVAATDIGQHYRLAHAVHDELIYVPRASDAQEMHDTVVEIMSRPPAWWPELVVLAEGGIGETYGDAK